MLEFCGQLIAPDIAKIAARKNCYLFAIPMSTIGRLEHNTDPARRSRKQNRNGQFITKVAKSTK